MDRRVLTIAVAVMLVLTCMPISIPGTHSQGGLFEILNVAWGSPASPTCVGPGMDVQMLSIVLRYNGNDTLAGVKAELYLPWYFRDTLSKTSMAEASYTQRVAKGQTIELKFWVDILERAYTGEYTADLVLYTYSGGGWQEVESHSIIITLNPIEKIAIKPTITSVYPGHSNVSIYIENLGSGYAYGVVLTTSTPSQQIAVIKSNIDVGDIGPGNTIGVDIPVYIPPSLAGSLIPLNLKVDYIDSCGLSRTHNTAVYLSIEQPKAPQLVLRASPTTLTAGMNNTVKITIFNNGSIAAKEISLTFELPQQIILVSGSARLFIGELKPEESRDVILTLMPISISGDRAVLQIYATLNYRDQYDVARSDKMSIPLTVARLQPSIAVDVQPRSLIAGRINEITLAVENTGNISVNGVDISVTLPQSIAIKGFDGRWFVGDLEPGEKVVTKLYLAIPSTVSGSIQMSVTLTYTEPSLTSRTEMRTISFLVTASEKPLSVWIVPQELEYGDNSIEVVVGNRGLERVSDVTITITSPQLIFKEFSGRWYIDYLEPGELRTLRITVFVPSSTSLVTQISLTVEYRDVVGVVRSETVVYGVVIKPTPVLLTTTVTPEQITVGENNITISICNNGSKPVYNLLAAITVQQAVVRGFDGRWFVGDLEPGRVRSITLLLTAPSTATSIQVAITLSYIDVGGVSKSESRTVVLAVRQPLINVGIWIEPQSVLQGENNVTIFIRNSGEVPIYDVALSLSPPQQVALIGSEGRIYIGRLDPGETKMYTLRFIAIASGATILQIPISISYSDPGGSYRTESRVVSLKLEAKPTTVNLRVSIEPYTVISGRYTTVNINIVNIAGRRLDDISLAISSGSVTLVGSDGRWRIGSLEPNGTRTISLTLYTNPTQTTQSLVMTATFTYIDTLTGVSVSEAIPIAILAVPETTKRPLEVEVSPQIIVAGQISNLTITIRNPNSFEVGPVTLSIAPPSGTILLAQDTYSIQLLKPGDKASVNIALYTPSASGVTVSLPISIDYFDGTTLTTLSKSIAFLVALPPTLKITNYAVLPQTISPGQTFSTSLTIANTGLGSAYNVTVRVLPSPIYTPLLGSEHFVGEIAKGATTTVTFSFRLSSEVNATAPRPANTTRPLNTTRPFPTTRNVTEGWHAQFGGIQGTLMPRVNLLIIYMDNVGRLYNTTLSIPLTITANTVTTATTRVASQNLNTDIVILLAAAPVTAILIYSIIRLRRR